MSPICAPSPLRCRRSRRCGWAPVPARPEPLHRLLITLAHLRLPFLARLAPLAQAALSTLAYGEHRGGMFIQATGTENGHPVTRAWHMLAEGDDGPLIPAMPIAALIHRAARGHNPEPGARSGIDALSLADYDDIFARYAITTGWRDAATGPLCPSILGTAFATLPQDLQDLHQPGALARWSGRAQVRRGPGPAAALICRLFAFPKAGDDIPVTVTFATAPNGTEIWSRRFGPTIMRSTQEAGQGRRACP